MELSSLTFMLHFKKKKSFSYIAGDVFRNFEGAENSEYIRE